LKNLFSKDANYEEVIKDNDALNFHADRFERGFRYPLAKACFHYRQSKEK